MNVYIDLEATQFNKEIISFGAVSENNKRFYLLVKPLHIDKITPFITRLTGLRPEMYTDAVLSIKEVSKQFWNWCLNLSENLKEKDIKIFCYGDFDISLIDSEIIRYPDCIELRKIRNRLYNPCIAINIIVFNTSQTRSLISLYKALYQEEIIQHHNALEDAEILMKVHQKIKNTSIQVIKEFEENYLIHRYINRYRKKKTHNRKLKKFFNSLSENEINSLTFKDIQFIVGNEYIESKIRRYYSNLIGRNWEGNIYV